MVTELEMMLRLLLSALLGGMIGLERESHRKPAGFRTHILVCVGSSLVMLLSIYAFRPLKGAIYDPGRLAAQVVSGIGFLGAGTILREGLTTRGLTTAASLWVVAGIGLAVGCGFYLAATATTGLVVVVLIVLDKVERRVISTKHDTLLLTVADRPGQLGAVATALGRHGVSIKGVDLQPVEEEQQAYIQLSIVVPHAVPKDRLLAEIAQVDGVFRARYQ